MNSQCYFTFPTEQVVSVNTMARIVAHAQVKGLRAVRGPVGLIVELPRVEDGLVHDLRDLDRVRGRTRAARLKGARRRVGDVAAVVRAVGVLAIPARGECHRHAPAAAARRFGEAGRVGAGARRAAKGALVHVGLASPAQALGYLAGVAVHGVSDEHAEALTQESVIRHQGEGEMFFTLGKAVTLALAWYPLI